MIKHKTLNNKNEQRQIITQVSRLLRQLAWKRSGATFVVSHLP